jgi:hypothetical protein
MWIIRRPSFASSLGEIAGVAVRGRVDLLDTEGWLAWKASLTQSVPMLGADDHY